MQARSSSAGHSSGWKRTLPSRQAEMRPSGQLARPVMMGGPPCIALFSTSPKKPLRPAAPKAPTHPQTMRRICHMQAQPFRASQTIPALPDDALVLEALPVPGACTQLVMLCRANPSL